MERREGPNIGSTIVGIFFLIVLLLSGLLLFTSVGESIRQEAFIDGSWEVEPTVPREVAVELQPSAGTPQAVIPTTPSPTVTPEGRSEPTRTSLPTLTPSEEGTPTPTLTVVTETPGPDYAATIAAGQSATPVPPPAPPPPPMLPPPPPPPPASPTSTATPTGTPTETPTGTPTEADGSPSPTQAAAESASPTQAPPEVAGSPSPVQVPPTTTEVLYELTDLSGSRDCGFSGIVGTIRNADGTPRQGVTVEVENEWNYRQSQVTNAEGFYEMFLGNEPREELAGTWTVRVLEDGRPQSEEGMVQISGSCEEGEHRFVADFRRVQ